MVMRLLRALQELGLLTLSKYALYSLALRSGYYRWRLPAQSWSQINLSDLLRSKIPNNPEDYAAYRKDIQTTSIFKLAPGQQPVLQKARRRIESEANSISEGSFQLFGIDNVELGSPPGWHAYAPLAGASGAAPMQDHRHWSLYTLEDLPHDVKLLWEASRFGWVYPLAQAYAFSGEDRYFDDFWTLFSSWLDENPPQMGLHWYSAQEVAIRLIALLYAFHTFSDRLNEFPEGYVKLLAAIAIHAQRIPPTLSYAEAQNNNHLLVESAALYLVGTALPELKSAANWRLKGRRLFDRSIEKQIFPDGGYVQHSSNYQRLALQVGILVAYAAEVEGQPLNEMALKALRAMAACLAALVDETQGTSPNFGPNDGAILVPLSARPFADFRPTVQAAWQLLLGERCYPPGPWDDFAAWLGVGKEGDKLPTSEVVALTSVDLPYAGLYTARKDRLRAYLRAVTFRNRPGHSDQLHLDIWYGDVNLARDPGTYLYNASQPWDNALSGSWCHNTVTVDRRDPMLRAGRFLWLSRSHALANRYRLGAESPIELLFARHRARQWPGLQHQRSVAILGSDLIIVSDDIVGQGRHQLTLNWNLVDLPWQVGSDRITLRHEAFQTSLDWSVEGGSWGLYRSGKCVDGDPVVENPATFGWHSPTYAQKVPGLQLVITTDQQLPLRMISTWSFNGADTSKLNIGWLPIEENRVAFKAIAWGPHEWAI